MSHDNDNLAAGRLGTPRPDSATSGGGKRAKTNYGFGRLGITPEQAHDPAAEPPPAPAKGEKDESAPATPPAQRPGQTVSRAEIARILEPDRAALTSSASSGRGQGGGRGGGSKTPTSAGGPATSTRGGSAPWWSPSPAGWRRWG